MNQFSVVHASCATRPARDRMQHGFTIIELMVVVTIGAILAAIAVPSFRDITSDMRTSSAIGLLVNDLNQARGEAIKRNRRMLVCVRNGAGTTCSSTAITATDWRAGWVVCADATTSGTDPELPPSDGQCDAVTVTSPEPNPVIVRPALDPSLTLSGSAAAFRFNPNSSQGAGGANATLTLGGTCRGNPVVRVVTIFNTGSISKQECPS